jgi:hypothetical protein
MPVLRFMLWTGRKCELSFYAAPRFPSFVWFANLAAFFCTWPNSFIWPSLYGSQHETPYSRIGELSNYICVKLKIDECGQSFELIKHAFPIWFSSYDPVWDFTTSVKACNMYISVVSSMCGGITGASIKISRHRHCRLMSHIIHCRKTKTVWN